MVGRPVTPVIIKHVDKKWYQTSVVRSDELWVVTYDGQPIKIKRDSLAYDMVAKHSTEVYTTENRANRRAAQFNAKFNTTLFGSKKLF